MSDALLAWEMNGAPLSLAHGGPLRLVVPGYNGVNNIKYVKRVAFTPTESQARIMSTGYRMTPPGEQVEAERALGPGAQRQVVRHLAGRRSRGQGRHRSTSPASPSAAARRSAASRCRATAAGPGSTRAFVGPDLGRFAWRQFALPLRMAAGNYVVVSRATDAAGNVAAGAAARERARLQQQQLDRSGGRC